MNRFSTPKESLDPGVVMCEVVGAAVTGPVGWGGCQSLHHAARRDERSTCQAGGPHKAPHGAQTNQPHAVRPNQRLQPSAAVNADSAEPREAGWFAPRAELCADLPLDTCCVRRVVLRDAATDSLPIPPDQ